MKVNKGNHCAYQTHYHIVFPVKYRKALLREEVVKQIKEILEELVERYEIEVEQVGCDYDHIHLLCSYHPKYSGGDIVRIVKSNTGRELFKKFPDLRKELWGGEFWSDGYYIATVGERGNWSVVEKYIKEQGKTMSDAQLRIIP